MCLSMYGWPLRNDQKKANLWKTLGEFLAERGLPFVVGGDFNETEEEVEKRLEDHGIPGMTVMTQKATCKSTGKDGKDNSRAIDGFIIARKLALWQHSGAALALEGHTSPHTAVKMQLEGINDNQEVWVHERPKATEPITEPKERIFGYEGIDKDSLDNVCKLAAGISELP